MHVLHLTTEFPPVIYGGLGTAIGGLARASSDAGLGVGVLLFGHDGNGGYGRPGPSGAPMSPAPAPEGIRLMDVSFHDDIDALARRAVSMRADILHLHSFWLWPYAAALRERLGIPLVYTVHSLDRAEYEIGHGPPECVVQWVQQEAVINGADRVIALTQSEQQLIREYCPDAAGRIRVLGNGVEDIPGRQTYRAADPTILFSGRFVERKGIHELIEAIRIVNDRVPGVRWVLAGGHRGCSGSEMAAWLIPSDRSDTYANVHFTGWLDTDEMAHHYREADILVVPSWYEPFGMVVLEGLLHGLAVAAARVGGPAEILEHRKTGWLFQPRDPAALADAVIELVRDGDTRQQIAIAGGVMVRERWLWSGIAQRMKAIYAEAAARRGASA